MGGIRKFIGQGKMPCNNIVTHHIHIDEGTYNGSSRIYNMSVPAYLNFKSINFNVCAVVTK